MTVTQYKTFLEDLAKAKKIEVQDVVKKLSSCGTPSLHGVGVSNTKKYMTKSYFFIIIFQKPSVDKNAILSPFQLVLCITHLKVLSYNVENSRLLRTLNGSIAQARIKYELGYYVNNFFFKKWT